MLLSPPVSEKSCSTVDQQSNARLLDVSSSLKDVSLARLLDKSQSEADITLGPNVTADASLMKLLDISKSEEGLVINTILVCSYHIIQWIIFMAVLDIELGKNDKNTGSSSIRSPWFANTA